MISFLLAGELQAKITSNKKHVQLESLNHKKKQTKICSEKTVSNIQSLERTADYLNQESLEKSVDNIIDQNTCQKFRTTIINAFDLLNIKDSVKKSLNCDQANFAGTHSNFLIELNEITALRSTFKLICSPCSKKSSSTFVDLKTKTIQICEANFKIKKSDLTKKLAKQIEYAFLQATVKSDKKNKIIEYQKKCSLLNTEEKYDANNSKFKNKDSAQPFFVIPNAETKYESIKAAHEVKTKIPQSVRHQNEPDPKPIPEKSISRSKLLASNNGSNNQKPIEASQITNNNKYSPYNDSLRNQEEITHQDPISSNSFNPTRTFNNSAFPSRRIPKTSSESETLIASNQNVVPPNTKKSRSPSSLTGKTSKTYTYTSEKKDNSFDSQNLTSNPKKESYNSATLSSNPQKKHRQEVSENPNEDENSQLTVHQKTSEESEELTNPTQSSITIPIKNLSTAKRRSIDPSDNSVNNTNTDKVLNSSELNIANNANLKTQDLIEDNIINKSSETPKDHVAASNTQSSKTSEETGSKNRTPQNDKTNPVSKPSEIDLKYLSGPQLASKQTKPQSDRTALSIHTVLNNLNHYNIIKLKQIFTENPSLIDELKINHIAIGFLNKSNEYYAIGDTAQPKKIYKEVSGKLVLTRDLADQ